VLLAVEVVTGQDDEEVAFPLAYEGNADFLFFLELLGTDGVLVVEGGDPAAGNKVQY